MNNIQVLDENTINQIAAGEVIDRPASVVKELIENAIDAKADAITIEIKEGGISFIRITDNGAGISKDEVKTAFLRHATSKIRSAEDLLSVSSLGFRGEALSSIASVAMVELITKTKDSMMGSRYEIKSGEEGVLEEVGVPDGTTFLIRNLFYNTPARKKFLKSAATESGYIGDVVQHLALSHPEVSFRFINNGKHMLNTSGNGNLKDVIYQIFGRDVANNLLELHVQTELVSIDGYIGKPIISRGNRGFEKYFINGRYIRSAMIHKSIEDGYKNFMMQHKYPFTVLHFTIEPELIDVNVHPAKMEIRFRNGEQLSPFIVDSIRDILSGKELIVEVKPEQESVLKADREVKKEIQIKTPEVFEMNRRKEEGVIPQYKDYGAQMAQKQEQTAAQSTLKEDISSPKEQYLISSSVQQNVVQTESNVSETQKTVEQTPKGEQMSLFSDKLLSEKARIHHKIIGQIFDTYWIIEYGDKMFIIDQHAAHEKVLFERMMAKLKDKENISQGLNPPIILTLTMREGELIKKYRRELLAVGYDIEEFGGNDFAVHTVPYDLYALAKEDLLMELIDAIGEEGSFRGSSELLLEKIASMSCKAAVKGNNHLSFAEANALLDELLTLENPYHCPHGRPVIISMSKYELEKKFNRIV